MKMKRAPPKGRTHGVKEPLEGLALELVHEGAPLRQVPDVLGPHQVLPGHRGAGGGG